MQVAQTSFNLMTDPEIRQMCRDDPVAAFEEIRSRGLEMPQLGEGQEIKVVFNTADTVYLPLTAISSDSLISARQLSQMQAAGGGDSTAGTIACGGSASTFSCPVGSASTASSVGSIGSAAIP